MLINCNTRIIGERVILVPYMKEHVHKYHEWMKSEELQKLTASEPLTLEEEYAMQESWRIDENKCTFIILDKEVFRTTNSEIDSMIGDTNLFFANEEDRLYAEAEIMIAESWARGKKCGSEAMFLMFLYGIEKIGVKNFIVKIDEENEVSLNMFKNSGFAQIEHSLIFHELTFSKTVDENWINWLKQCVGSYEIVTN